MEVHHAEVSSESRRSSAELSAPRRADLRHAHASWLLARGADLKFVMECMGQSQIQITQKYLLTLPDTDERNLGALARIQARQHRVAAEG